MQIINGIINRNVGKKISLLVAIKKDNGLYGWQIRFHGFYHENRREKNEGEGYNEE